MTSAPDQGWEDELREAVEYQTRRIAVGRPVAVVSADGPRDVRRERRLEAELGLDSSLSAAERLEMRRERGSDDPRNRRRPQYHGTLSECDYYGTTAPITRRKGRIHIIDGPSEPREPPPRLSRVPVSSLPSYRPFYHGVLTSNCSQLDTPQLGQLLLLPQKLLRRRLKLNLGTRD